MLNAVASACRLATGVALVVLTGIFGWLVYGRYVLNATPTWVEQVALLLVVFITFVGAALGVRDDTHLGVSYFRELCPPGVRRVMGILSHAVLFGFGALMAWAGYELAAFKWASPIPLLDISEGWRAVPVAIGGALVALFSLAHLVNLARGATPRDMQ